MSSKILLQFKAGRCFRDGNTNTVKPDATKGYFLLLLCSHTHTLSLSLCASLILFACTLPLWLSRDNFFENSTTLTHTHYLLFTLYVASLVYMEEEDGLLHFFWRNRTTNAVEDVRGKKTLLRKYLCFETTQQQDTTLVT
jgi:hypothetical protein